jgi:hypothetical protein
MRTKKLIVTSQEVKQYTGANNIIRKKLIDVVTPKGTTYAFKGPLQIFLKLVDAAGVQIPASSYLVIAKRRPGDDFETLIRRIPYSGYYDISETQQRDVRFTASTIHDLGVAGIENPENHVLEFWIESPVTVDLTRPETRVEFTAFENN